MVHPGRDKYDGQPPAFRRMLLLSWMMAVALSDYAIRLATEDHVPRKELITQVIDHYDSERLRPLRISLENAKEQVLAVWATHTRGTQLVKKIKRTRHGAAKVTFYFSLKLISGKGRSVGVRGRGTVFRCANKSNAVVMGQKLRRPPHPHWTRTSSGMDGLGERRCRRKVIFCSVYRVRTAG
jgi:hypothetical protein